MEIHVGKRYGDYIVYTDGSIYSIKKDKNKPHKLKPDIIKHGYEQVTLSINGNKERWKVHRLVAYLFIPNPNNLPQVNHINGNKHDNSIYNLEWCDAKYNNRHAVMTGLNDISKSNSDRWKNKEWANKVRKNISDTRIKNKTGYGKNNSMWRYELYIDGVFYDRQDAANFYNVTPDKISRLIYKYLNNEPLKPPFDTLIVIDTKRQSTIERIE